MDTESRAKLGRILLILGRIALGVIFLVAAWSKLKPILPGQSWSVSSVQTSLAMFAMGVDSYQMVSSSAASTIAHVLPFFELVLGLWLALLLNHNFKGKAFTRAFILLPFIIPTVLSTLAWKWMFDPTFSVINWMLFRLGLIHSRINWLGDPNLALISVIVVNVWRGLPFYAISLLAGLQTISPELHEAAAIDGARAWQRFRHVTWPLLLPVTLVIVLFSVIQTFADFQLVYVLTGGGPANATQLFATYAYQLGIGTGLLSEGATISLAVFPVLLLVVIVQLLYIRRVETH